MAVQLKSDGYGLLGLIGVNPALMDVAKSAGITVDQPFPGSFYVKYKGQTYGSINVKGQAITLAKSGSLGPASKEALNSQFTSALKSALQAASDSGEAVGLSGMDAPAKPKVAPGMKSMLMGKGTLKSGDQTIGEVSSMEINIEAPKTSFAKPQLDWDDPVAVMTSGTLTPLLKAHKLYQPVYGTYGGSVYITVALLDGAQMAGRVAAGKLSLRAEGPKLDNYLSQLADLGFGYKAKDGYASVHYDIQDEALLLKTFGAVIGRLGFGQVKECADIMLIKGYGK